MKTAYSNVNDFDKHSWFTRCIILILILQLCIQQSEWQNSLKIQIRADGVSVPTRVQTAYKGYQQTDISLGNIKYKRGQIQKRC